MNGAEEPCKRVSPPSQSCNSTGESAKVRPSPSYSLVCVSDNTLLIMCVYAIGSDVTMRGHEQLRSLPALCAPHRSGTVRIRVRVWCVSLRSGRRVCLPGHAGIRPHLRQSRSDPDQLARTEPVLWVTHTYSLSHIDLIQSALNLFLCLCAISS